MDSASIPVQPVTKRVGGRSGEEGQVNENGIARCVWESAKQNDAMIQTECLWDSEVEGELCLTADQASQSAQNDSDLER